jgi:hypothetical protein
MSSDIVNMKFETCINISEKVGNCEKIKNEKVLGWGPYIFNFLKTAWNIL